MRSWLAMLALLGTGCPDFQATSCTSDETVLVKMTGSCATGARTFEIRQIGCGLYLQPQSSDASVAGDAGPGAITTLGLPTRGALAQSGAPIRQGGWHLWGCLASNEPCPDDFRFCSTHRTGFQLNVTCLDGTGALACEAVLTE